MGSDKDGREGVRRRCGRRAPGAARRRAEELPGAETGAEDLAEGGLGPVSSGKRWTTCGPRWTRRSPSLRPPTPPRRSRPMARWMPRPIPRPRAAVELEMGDVLFSLVNVARKMGVQAEEALRATCGKFRTRWAFMEGAAARPGPSRGRPLHGGNGRALAALEGPGGRWPRLKYGIGAF